MSKKSKGPVDKVCKGELWYEFRYVMRIHRDGVFSYKCPTCGVTGSGDGRRKTCPEVTSG